MSSLRPLIHPPPVSGQMLVPRRHFNKFGELSFCASILRWYMPIVDTTSGATVDQGMMDFITSKWRPPRACSVCGTNSWNLEQRLAELRFLSLGGFFVGGPVVPLIVITCNNCGNTIFINAMKAGWKLPTPPENPPATEGGAR